MQVLPDRKTGAETGVKTIAAVHSQCRIWVDCVDKVGY